MNMSFASPNRNSEITVSSYASADDALTFCSCPCSYTSTKHAISCPVDARPARTNSFGCLDRNIGDNSEVFLCDFVDRGTSRWR